MTIADELRMEGEVRGKIKMCQELMEKGLIHREVAEQKIAELSKRLEEIAARIRMGPASGPDAPDQASA